MTMRSVLRSLLIIWAVCWGTPIIAVPVGPAMNIDIPAANSVMPQMFQLAGWAIDTNATSGTGVDLVEVWGHPMPGPGTPIHFGNAVYGHARPDVGTAFGDSRFANSGWYLNVVGQAPGVYEIHIKARSTVTGTSNQERIRTVTLTANPRMSIDIPNATTTAVHQPFSIVGWAIDLASATGTGVHTVHVWSRRLDVPGSPDVFVGAAPYGSPRPDVGAAFGARFTNSAYSQTVTGLAPGRYRFIVYARSTLTLSFNQAKVIDLDVDPSVAPPVFGVPAGTYTSSFSVSAPTITQSATVHYTTNGTEPTTSSPTGPVSVDASMTVKAKAFRTDWTPSTTTTAAYVLQVATPTVSVPAGPYTTDFSVQVTSPTPSSEVRYTTNGTEPTTTSPLLPALQYFVNGTVTLKVKAFRTDWTPSATTTAVYTRQPSPPVASPVAGTYAVGQVVMLTASGPFDQIRYTTNGTEPTASSPLFDAVNPLVLTEPTTVRARSFHPQYAPSTEIQVAYVTRVATPTLSPIGGEFMSPPTVTMTTTTSGATIRYTTNGNIPTENSTAYVSPITVPLGSTVTAKAFKTGWAESQASEGEVYVSSEPAPVSTGTVTGNPSVISGFTSITGNAVFNLSDAFLNTVPGSVVAYRGQTMLPVVIPSPTSFQVGGLTEGENRLDISGVDSQGLPFELSSTVWAGSRSVHVTVRNRSTQALSGASVVGALGEERSIVATATTTGSGVASLANTPTGSELWVTASAPGYRSRSALVPAGQTSLTLTLDSTNLAFDEGLAGWTSTAGANAWAVSHAEIFPGWVPCPSCIIRSSPAPDGSAMPGSGTDSLQTPQMRADAPSGSDMDVLIQSMNTTAPMTVSRRFWVAPGISQVQVRYRFATTELQALAPQNDAFLVRMTNVTTGTVAQEVTSVAGLAGQFTGPGVTGWRTRTLAVAADQEVEVVFQVQNAVDAAHISTVEGDVVTEQGLQVPVFELYDQRLRRPPNGATGAALWERLDYLSVSSHPSYGGMTRVNGTLHVTGAPTDRLQAVTVEVLEGTTVRATAPLVTPAASALIGVPFGTVGVKITVPQLFFEIPSSQLATINQTTEDRLTLRVRLVSQHGHTVVIRLGEPGVSTTTGRRVKKLTRYTGPNRYGGPQNDDRDLDTCSGTASPWLNFPCGGDSWALPKNITRAAALSGVTFNDFSNMNAGHYPPHTSHAIGEDVDVKWPALTSCSSPPCLPWFKVTQASAEKLIALFSTDAADAIDFVYVTFEANSNNAFWTTVRNATVGGVRLIPEDVAADAETIGTGDARALIRSKGRIRFRPAHSSHFHIHWKN